MPTLRHLILFFALAVSCAISFPVGAKAGGSTPPPYHPAFKMLVTWNEEDGSGVEFMLWYPTMKAGTTVDLGPWTFSGSRNGKHAEGKFPLVIISHDTGASKFSHNDTARQLASAGFVVAAPTHNSDNNNNMQDLYTAEEIFGRVKEIHLIVDFLKKDEYADFVDTGNIGVLGVGTGACTALILAGGMVDIRGYSKYCNDDVTTNDLCSPWVKQRLATLSFHLPRPGEDRLPGIRALALAAPRFIVLFTRESLKAVTAKTYIYEAELEPYAQAETLRSILGANQKYIVLPGMDGRDLTAPCSGPLGNGPTWQCDPEPEDSLELRQKLFNSSLESFFKQMLQAGKE